VWGEAGGRSEEADEAVAFAAACIREGEAVRHAVVAVKPTIAVMIARSRAELAKRRKGALLRCTHTSCEPCDWCTVLVPVCRTYT